uniref:NADH-ubiquinone oxidoreductase chain 2 n=1 Tax=Scolytinae sp. BMNH 1040146 TaxID=1903785 RepID=A0A343A554_9CUCU|nr:NADH dehydrogenase subunit 2 [Scolytinae sp. BMNH 1040146]
MLFLSTLMIGTVISISATSWFTAWMGLEINLLSLIPLMKKFNNNLATEATLKYFIVQAMASMILLMTSLMFVTTELQTENMKTLSILMDSSLFIKMGAAPLHFWVPEVVSGISWNLTLLILTWQKITPMILLMYTNYNPTLMTIIIIMSSLTGGLMGINQICIRKILAYSSINHIGWMLSASLFSMMMWLMYFLIYSIMNLSIILMLKENKIYFLNQINKIKNFSMKLKFSMNFLSLGGLPPFLGFLPKWLTVHSLIMKEMFYLPVILIISTLISLYIYMRLTFFSFTNSISNSMNMTTKYNLSTMFTIFSAFSSISLILLINLSNLMM